MKSDHWIFFLTSAFLLAALFGLWGSGGVGLLSLLLAILLAGVCLAVCCIRLLRMTKPIRLRQIAVTLLPLIAIALVFLRVDARVVNAFKGPVVFSGTCEHTVTFVHLILHEDGSCEFEPGSFLDRNWQNGTWDQSKDTVRVRVEEARKAGPVEMDLLITSEGLRELSGDKLHSHGFAGNTVVISSLAGSSD